MTRDELYARANRTHVCPNHPDTPLSYIANSILCTACLADLIDFDSKGAAQ